MGQKIIATIGSFDGVHRGHAMLLGQMRDLAQHYGEAELHVVTFSPYPSDVLRPDLTEQLITLLRCYQVLDPKIGAKDIGWVGGKGHDMQLCFVIALSDAVHLL